MGRAQLPRVVGFAFGFGVALSVAIGATAATYWHQALRTARQQELGTHLVERQLLQRSDASPLVVFLGDSTLAPHPTAPPFPKLLQRDLGAGAEVRVLATAGLDFFHFYYLLGPVLEQRPDAIVVVANLMLIGSDQQAQKSNLLARHIPRSELLRSMSLPLEARGLTPSKLLLIRALRYDAVRRWLYFFDGLRIRFQSWLGRSPSNPPMEVGQLIRSLALEALRRELSRTDPLVQMLGATVATATRAGVAVMVYVSPVPVERLAAAVGGEDALHRRIRVLQEIVEENGGQFLDLHAALPDREFRDDLGHFNAEGNARLGELFKEPLSEMLAHSPSIQRATAEKSR